MTDPEILDSLSDVDALACTAWGEAAGDSREGHSSVEERIAVMSVVRNRVRHRAHEGVTYKGVCLAPKQFSCWNAGTDANHLRVMAMAYLCITGQTTADAVFEETRFLAGGIISGLLLDRVHGATLYYAPAAMVPPNRVPAWAAGRAPVAGIGSQLFFTE